MSWPDFVRPAKPIRTFGRSPRQNPVPIAKKVVIPPPDDPDDIPSYSQMLNVDNSLIMDFDIDKIEQESSEFD